MPQVTKTLQIKVQKGDAVALDKFPLSFDLGIDGNEKVNVLGATVDGYSTNMPYPLIAVLKNNGKDIVGAEEMNFGLTTHPISSQNPMVAYKQDHIPLSVAQKWGSVATLAHAATDAKVDSEEFLDKETGEHVLKNNGSSFFISAAKWRADKRAQAHVSNQQMLDEEDGIIRTDDEYRAVGLEMREKITEDIIQNEASCLRVSKEEFSMLQGKYNAFVQKKSEGKIDPSKMHGTMGWTPAKNFELEFASVFPGEKLLAGAGPESDDWDFIPQQLYMVVKITTHYITERVSEEKNQ